VRVQAILHHLILRCRAEHGVSKDRRKTLTLWLSFETPAMPAPQDEVAKEAACMRRPGRRHGIGMSCTFFGTS